MTKCLFAVLLFIASLSCSLSYNPSFKKSTSLTLSMLEKNSPFKEKYSPLSGEVPLILKNSSFFVHVDFVNHEKDASDTDHDNDDYGHMIPALYTDKTFFGKECQGFSDYCDKYSFRCLESFKPKSHYNFPYFESDGHFITSEVYLDYGHWKLRTKAVVSGGCDGYYAVGGYGLLGMGFDGDSLINYLTKQPKFAVHIERGLKNGTLSFYNDISKAKSNVPAAKINTDSNWRITGVKSLAVDTFTEKVNLNVIFDLGSDSIGLPVEVLEKVIAAIEQQKSIEKCEIESNFTPTCNFTGDVRKLPIIYLYVADQKIPIPPEVYVIQTQRSYFYSGSISLRLKALSNDTTKGAFVTPAHLNYVILGYPMMSYFYTVFDGGKKVINPKFSIKPSISLYYSKDFESPNRLNMLLVIAGFVGFLFFGFAFYCYKLHDSKEKLYEQRAFLVKKSKKIARRLH